MPEFLDRHPKNGKADAHLFLAHGAGAPMDSPFMHDLCEFLAECKIATTRFEFAYMSQRREGGKRRPPPRAEMLQSEFIEALDARFEKNSRPRKLLIGGKSMGGRVASLIASRPDVDGLFDGLVCIGYPFHPPGKPDRLRTEHLAALDCSTLIVQGERDPLGNREEVAAYTLARTIKLHWIIDGDHDLKPRRASGITQAQALANAAGAVAKFASALK